MVKFFCIGRNNVDIYLQQNKVYPGGNCNNVAAHLAKFGYQAALMTVVGKDTLGNLQLKTLERLGVDVSPSHVVDGQTAWCCISHDSGNRKFVRSDLSIFKDHLISYEDVRKAQGGDYDVIYTCVCRGAYFENGVFESLGDFHIPVCCDFADRWTEEEVYRACEYIRYPYLSCEQYSLEETMRILKNCVDHGAELALGTRGLQGSVAYNGRRFFQQKAYHFPVVDTLGAGDSFLARFSMCYFEGMKELGMIRLKTAGDAGGLMEEAADKVIEYSLYMAAVYATYVCGYYGGFGNGVEFDPSMIKEEL